MWATSGPGWGYFFLAGGGALLIAALVAWQLSRRMSRPLVEARDATARIAAGDLESRVPLRDHDYSESTSLARSINEMAQSLEEARRPGASSPLVRLARSADAADVDPGFAEAITDGAVEDTAQAAGVIIAESRRLERLVGDLLDLTKLEANQMSISVRPTDVAEVVSTTAEGFRPSAERSGVQLTVHLPSDAQPLAMIDPDRLAQILANLVENALVICPYIRGRHTFGSRFVNTIRGQVITVEDDGPGIAAADLTRVFDRFYQADHGPNRQLGSGLGLAIVAELASAMGATVRAESPVGPHRGARFEVTLAGGDSQPPP
jgi:signal transduction histidine kinase